MTTYGYRGPTIDHSLLSPSGRMSKRARKAATDREVARLFAGCGPLKGEGPPPRSEAQYMWDTAAQLLELADRGMSTRKYRREAERLLARAALLEGPKP
jgi:hypothetical protein